MNQHSQCRLKDVVLEILQIIMNTENDAELRKEVLNYFSSQREDIFHIFKFMIFSKTKEELQTKVVRYLISRQPLLFEFLEKLSSEKHSKNLTENREGVDDKHSSSSIESSANDKPGMQKQSEKNKVMNREKEVVNSGLKSKKKSKSTGTDTEQMENDEERPRKRRRSKYDYIYLQGDLSHICREPKSSKANKSQNESSGKVDADDTCKIEEDIQESIMSNDESVSGAIQEVKSMIETLTKPSSKQSREEVLGVLRSDPSVRKVFMKEKERLGKQKIPIFTYSKRQEQEDRSYLFKQSEAGSVEQKRSSELQDTISFLLGAFSQSTHEEKYDDIHKMNFSSEDMEEAFPQILGIQPEQTSDISQFVVTDSSDPNSPIVDSTTYTQLPCPSDSPGDQDIVNEMLLDQTKTIIDNALHEHFQQLSRDQYSINNAHLLSDNEIMHL